MAQITIKCNTQEMNSILEAVDFKKIEIIETPTNRKNKMQRAKRRNLILQNTTYEKIKTEALFRYVRQKGYPYKRHTFKQDVNYLEACGKLKTILIHTGKYRSGMQSFVKRIKE